MQLHFNQKPTRFWSKFLKIELENESNSHEQRISLARENIIMKRSRANQKINKNRRLVEFQIGDLVLVKALRTSNSKENKIAKFFNVFEGPYRIKQKFGPTTYLLQNTDDDSERGKFHVNNLKLYHVN